MIDKTKKTSKANKTSTKTTLSLSDDILATISTCDRINQSRYLDIKRDIELAKEDILDQMRFYADEASGDNKDYNSKLVSAVLLIIAIQFACLCSISIMKLF